MKFGAGEWILLAIIATLTAAAIVHHVRRPWDKTLIIPHRKPYRRRGLVTRRDALFFATGFGFGFWLWFFITLRSMQ